MSNRRARRVDFASSAREGLARGRLRPSVGENLKSGPAVRQHPGPGTESLSLDASRLSRKRGEASREARLSAAPGRGDARDWRPRWADGCGPGATAGASRPGSRCWRRWTARAATGCPPPGPLRGGRCSSISRSRPAPRGAAPRARAAGRSSSAPALVTVARDHGVPVWTPSERGVAALRPRRRARRFRSRPATARGGTPARPRRRSFPVHADAWARRSRKPSACSAHRRARCPRRSGSSSARGSPASAGASARRGTACTSGPSPTTGRRPGRLGPHRRERGPRRPARAARRAAQRAPLARAGLSAQAGARARRRSSYRRRAKAPAGWARPRSTRAAVGASSSSGGGSGTP